MQPVNRELLPCTSEKQGQQKSGTGSKTGVGGQQHYSQGRRRRTLADTTPARRQRNTIRQGTQPRRFGSQSWEWCSNPGKRKIAAVRGTRDDGTTRQLNCASDNKRTDSEPAGQKNWMAPQGLARGAVLPSGQKKPAGQRPVQNAVRRLVVFPYDPPERTKEGGR